MTKIMETEMYTNIGDTFFHFWLDCFVDNHSFTVGNTVHNCSCLLKNKHD